MNVVLSEHLPLLASAPDGIQKLRGLILELAVRGRLVPQDPDDEPASELLKRIAEERTRLEAEGSGKKSKATPLVDLNLLPFEVPDGWEWATLGQIGETNIGLTYSPTNLSTVGIPVLRSSNVQKGMIDLSDLIRVDMPVKDSVLVREGDLLICARNGSKALVGKTALITGLSEEMAFGAFMAIFRSIANPYLLYFINSPLFRRTIDDVNTTTINQITQGNLKATAVPLPPLAEQHRIVAKVDELMALCDRLEMEQADAASAHARLVETLLGTLTQSTDAADLAANWQRVAEHFDTLFTTEASIDALKQTVLQLAVMGKWVPQDPNDEPASDLLKRIAQERGRLEREGICKKTKPVLPVGEDEKPFEVPAGWAWERIGNYVIQTDYGLSEKTFPATDGVPILKMGDIQAGQVILGGQKAVPPTTEGLPYLFLEPDDLLYNRTNSAELVGKTGVFRGPSKQYSFASYLIRIRCLNKFVSPTFLNFVMNAPMFRETEIVPHLKQQCGQANVNGTILRNMRIPVPPAAEQHRIVAKVEELVALCDRLKADLAESRSRQVRLSATLIESALQAA